MKAFLISDNIDTATGMRLAGIESVVVHEKDELIQAFEQVLKDKGVGIIFVTELLSTKFPTVVANVKLNYKQPLILEIPDRHGNGRTKDSITKYVQDAIGVKI